MLVGGGEDFLPLQPLVFQRSSILEGEGGKKGKKWGDSGRACGGGRPFSLLLQFGSLSSRTRRRGEKRKGEEGKRGEASEEGRRVREI